MAGMTTDLAAIARGRDAVDAYAEANDWPDTPPALPASSLAGLLCDLMHYAEARGLDWGYAMQDAERNFTQERAAR